jgi:hypothetical protein
MQPFETVILLQVQGVLYLYYWVIHSYDSQGYMLLAPWPVW